MGEAGRGVARLDPLTGYDEDGRTDMGQNTASNAAGDEHALRRSGFTATPGSQEIVMENVFDAPRQLVWKVFTDPELVPEWWGPKGLTTVVDAMDLAPGGAWRYSQRNAQGVVYSFHGVYHEVSRLKRLVRTSEFDGMPGRVALEIATFGTRVDGKTKVTNKAVFESVADRNAALAAGLEQGALETWERFAELLASS